MENMSIEEIRDIKAQNERLLKECKTKDADIEFLRSMVKSLQDKECERFAAYNKIVDIIMLAEDLD